VAVWPALGGDPPPVSSGDETTDALLAQERLRSSVEAIFERYLAPAPDGASRIDMAIAAAEEFASLGPDVAPYLINELEQERRATFDLCSYALGMLATPEAEMGLREAVARADAEYGDAALSRKAWALWGLALQGKPESIRLMAEGRHRVANYPMHNKTTLIETAALLTAPASFSALMEVLEIVVPDEERWQERRATLRALRRLGDPSATPKIVPLLEHADATVRRDAADALRTMGTPAAVSALVEALSDETVVVRRLAAAGLAYTGSPDHRERILERLDRETDVHVRGSLYTWLADTAGSEAFDLLMRYRGRPEGLDRRRLIEALELVDDPRRLPHLRAALSDEDNGAALQAVMTLGRLAGEEASGALVDAVVSGRTNVAQAAAERLARRGDLAAGAAIARRLIDDVLAEAGFDQSRRIAAERMSSALVTLGHTKALKDLRAWLAGETDPRMAASIELAARQLDLIRRNGRKVARWIETATETDREIRHLAWRELAKLGSADAVRALAEAFDTADRSDRLEILRVLGEAPEALVAPLLERVLLDPGFDDTREIPLRDMAAWSARRLGGDAMWKLLEASVERRQGRDARVAIYAAVLGGERALPLLRSLRPTRMRFLGFTRGNEQERLDWIAARLASGRSIARVDVEPEKLFFR
jgi:HEAT repeat protein